MPDQPSGFTVTDRRKFTLDGELRDDAPSPSESVAVPEPAGANIDPAEEPKPKLGPQLVQDNTKPDNSRMDKEVVSPELEPLPGEEGDGGAGDDNLGPELTAAETAQQDAEYRASSKKLDDMLSQANPGSREALGGRGAEMNFDRLVQSIYMTAALQLGAGTQPGEQPRVDILGARQSIDMLSVLTEKTKGNLTDKEQRLLQNALFELRMMFMEITNAISASAHNPAGKPPVR